MANWAVLTGEVVAEIKPNGVQSITGAKDQAVRLNVIEKLGAHYIKGKVGPSFDPGDPDGNVLYYSDGPGIYQHFGFQKVSAGEFWMFRGTGTSWVRDRLFKVDPIAAIPGPFTGDDQAKLSPAGGGASLVSGDIYKSTGEEDGYGPRLSWVE